MWRTNLEGTRCKTKFSQNSRDVWLRNAKQNIQYSKKILLEEHAVCLCKLGWQIPTWNNLQTKLFSEAKDFVDHICKVKSLDNKTICQNLAIM